MKDYIWCFFCHCAPDGRSHYRSGFTGICTRRVVSSFNPYWFIWMYFFNASYATLQFPLERSGRWGTEESGNQITDAAHDHDMFIFIVKTEEFSDCVSDTATHLQGGTFTAGRSAKQVRDQCGNKDQRSHAPGRFVIRVDCLFHH